MFVEGVVVLDAAISRVVTEHMSGQPVLFRDSSEKIQRQLEMSERLSEAFNSLGGRAAGAVDYLIKQTSQNRPLDEFGSIHISRAATSTRSLHNRDMPRTTLLSLQSSHL